LAPPKELDLALEHILSQDSLFAYDPLDLVLPSDKVILEAMIGPDKPCDDIHHKSYFLPKLKTIEVVEFIQVMNGDAPCPINPLSTHRIYDEGNMESIAKTIPIDISRTPCIMENVFVGAYCSPEENQIFTELFKKFHDVFSWSYDKIPCIDPRIIEHEITTYPNVKPIQ
jgi:hypothetical protein